MSYRTYQKRTAALASLAALAGSAVLMAAPVAHAEVVDVEYNCETPIGDRSAVSPIDIKGVEEGDGYKITMSWQKGVSASPVELGRGAMRPSATIKLSGAETGTLTVTGPANQEAIPADTPIKINDLSGTYTPKESGKVEFTAGVLTIRALGTVTTCTPGNNPGPSLSLDVTAAEGGGATGGTGGSGGSASGGTGGSGGADGSGGSGGSGGELPQTGPLDSAVALGTLGGTVLLAGTAGVLWVTRRNQAVRR